MRLALGLLLTAALLTVPVAADARPAGTTPNAERLQALGVTATWPLERGATTLKPGAPLVVAVRSKRRVVEVSLAHVGAAGRDIASRRLRHGAFRTRVPAGNGRHYALRLRVGRLLYRSWIDTPVAAPAAPSPAAPAPAPTPTPQQGDPFDCPAAGAGAPAATLTVDTTSVPVGNTFNYTLHNTGGVCLGTGYGYKLERLADGAWVDQPWPPNTAVPLPLIVVRPGASWSAAGTAWTTLPAGHYRMTVTSYAEPRTAPATAAVPASAEFDVTAP